MKALIVVPDARGRAFVRSVLDEVKAVTGVTEARDAYEAREQVLRGRPDLLLLELSLPKVNGMSLLRTLQQNLPIPTVVFSGMVGRSGEIRAQALRLGASAAVARDTGDLGASRVALRAALDELVAGLAQTDDTSASRKARSWARQARSPIVLVGASTGGPDALAQVVPHLSGLAVPAAVVQHIPPRQAQALAVRLNSLCRGPVRLAGDGVVPRPGEVVIAPGGRHLELRRHAGHLRFRLSDGPAEHYQRPAVDVLFRSAARSLRGNCVAALLTGMGADGARGMQQLRSLGAFTVAQDAATSTVFGMPREAGELGGVDQYLPLDRIGPRIRQLVERLRGHCTRAA